LKTFWPTFVSRLLFTYTAIANFNSDSFWGAGVTSLTKVLVIIIGTLSQPLFMLGDFMLVFSASAFNGSNSILSWIKSLLTVGWVLATDLLIVAPTLLIAVFGSGISPKLQSLYFNNITY
jgi:hypothetical protein